MVSEWKSPVPGIDMEDGYSVKIASLTVEAESGKNRQIDDRRSLWTIKLVSLGMTAFNNDHALCIYITGVPWDIFLCHVQ